MAVNFRKTGKINRILLTGAGGQIGLALLPYRNKIYGHQNVLCTDIAVPKDQQQTSNNKWVTLNICEKENIKAIVNDFKPDQIIHYAAYLSALSEQNPKLSFEININGFQNILNVAADKQIKFFTASSIASFGPTSPKDNTPNECVMKPKSIYGISKVYCELMGSYYKQKFGVDFRSLRYPIVISPIYAKNGSAAYICQIFFEGLKTDTLLPFIYIDDLLEGTIKFLEIEKENLSVENYNQGGLSFTPQQIINELKEKYIPDLKISLSTDFRQAVVDTWPRSIDSSISFKDWGWQPRFNLEKMVQEMVNKVKIQISKNEFDF